MKTFYACSSEKEKWCGFAHDTHEQARKCQALQKSKNDEERETHEIVAASKIRAKEICLDKFGIHDHVQERVDKFLAGAKKQYAKKKESEPKITPADKSELEKLNKLIEQNKKSAKAQGVANKLEGHKKIKLEDEIPKKPKPRPTSDKHELQDLLIQLVDNSCNVMLKGPAGSGKTYVAKLAAKLTGKQFYMLPALMDKFEVMGFVRPDGGYQTTQYYEWASNPNGGILLLDEFDASFPQAALALNAGIARGGIVTFPNNEHFEITENHIVIAAANTFGLGPSAEYCGRNKLDAATLDRFEAILDWDYDKKLERGIALQLPGSNESNKNEILDYCDRAHQIRNKIQEYGIQTIFATRSLIAFVKLRLAGFSEKEALKVSKLATLDEKQKKQVLAV